MTSLTEEEKSIVERLRGPLPFRNNGDLNITQMSLDQEEAAATIQRLERELEKLEKAQNLGLSKIPFRADEIARLSKRVEDLERGLKDAEQTMRNAWGAITSNQIGDKDVAGMLRDGMSEARSALAEAQS